MSKKSLTSNRLDYDYLFKFLALGIYYQSISILSYEVMMKKQF